MESKRSSNPNRTSAVLRENFRRFWPASLASILLLFFSGPYIAIMRGYTENNWFWREMLANMNVGFLAAHIFIPISAAVCVFKYLHTPGPVAVTNALPFSRSHLFWANTLSGFLIAFVPVVLNALIMLLINPASASGILRWLLVSFLIEGVIYAISVLSCCLTGTVVHSFLGSFFFNGIVPALLLLFYGYESFFLWGLSNNDSAMTNIAMLHPFSGAILREYSGGLSIGWIAFYFAVILVAVFIAFRLYIVRKMERAGDALAFHGFRPVMTLLITFVGMSCVAFLFSYSGDEMPQFFIGCLIGFAIAWIAGRMLVMKTVRIFGKKDLRNLLVCFLVCALFVTGFVTDVFGIEKYVPAVKEGDRVDVTLPRLSIPYGNNMYNDTVNFQTYDSVKDAAMLHQEIIDRKDMFVNKNGNTDWSRYDSFSYPSFTYKLSHRVVSRDYTVPTSLLACSENAKRLYESDEYKTAYGLAAQESHLYTRFDAVDLSSRTLLVRSATGAVSRKVASDSDAGKLILAMEKDWYDMTYAEMLASETPLAFIELDYTVFQRVYESGEMTEETYPSQDLATVTYTVFSSCTETIRCLKELGLWDDISLRADLFCDAYVYEYQIRSHSGNGPYYVGSEDYAYMKSSEYDTLLYAFGQDDTDAIDAILARSTSKPLDSTDYIYVLLAYPEDGIVSSSRDYQYVPMGYLKLYLEDASFLEQYAKESQ